MNSNRSQYPLELPALLIAIRRALSGSHNRQRCPRKGSAELTLPTVPIQFPAYTAVGRPVPKDRPVRLCGPLLHWIARSLWISPHHVAASSPRKRRDSVATANRLRSKFGASICGLTGGSNHTGHEERRCSPAIVRVKFSEPLERKPYVLSLHAVARAPSGGAPHPGYCFGQQSWRPESGGLLEEL
jgi:hypothetical protein